MSVTLLVFVSESVGRFRVIKVLHLVLAEDLRHVLVKPFDLIAS